MILCSLSSIYIRNNLSFWWKAYFLMIITLSYHSILWTRRLTQTTLVYSRTPTAQLRQPWRRRCILYGSTWPTVCQPSSGGMLRNKLDKLFLSCIYHKNRGFRFLEGGNQLHECVKVRSRVGHSFRGDVGRHDDVTCSSLIRQHFSLNTSFVIVK